MNSSMIRSQSLRADKVEMEALEPRQLLSGNVAASVVNDNLVINGDGSSNDIVITVGNKMGRYQVSSGTNPTKINGIGTPFMSSIVRGDVIINLNGGNDTLRLTGIYVPGELAINTGAGSDIVIMLNTSIGGDFSFTNADGTSSTTMTSVTVHGNASYQGSTGVDRLTATSLTVLNSMTVLGGGLNRNFYTFSNSTIGAFNGGLFTLRSGGGHDQATFTGMTFNGGVDLRNTDVNLSTSEVHDVFSISDSATFNYSIDLTNNIFVDAVNISTGSSADVVTISNDAFRGPVSILTHQNNDTVSINGGTFTNTVLINAGVGKDSLSIATTANVTFDGDVTIIMPGSSNILNLGSGASSANFNAGVSLTMNGTNVVSLSNMTFAKDVTILTSAGNDMITINGCTFDGTFTLDTGAGNDIITVASAGAVAFNGTASITGGSGTNTVNLGSGGSAISFNNGMTYTSDGTDVLNIANAFFAGPTLILNEVGIITVNINGTSFLGAFRLDTDPAAGADTINIGTTGNVTFTGNVNITGSGVVDAITIGSAATTVLFLNPVSIQTLAGADTVTVDGSTFNDFVQFDVAGGNDTINIATNAAVTFNAGVSILLSDGNNSLTIGSAGNAAAFNGQVSITGLGDDVIAISNATFLAPVSILTQDGIDTITINASTFVDTLDIETGAGNDAVTIASTGADTFDRDVTVDLGNGNNTITIGSGAAATFNAGLSIFGIGNNVATISGSTVVGPVSILTSGGVDTININGSTLTGIVDIETGAGADAVNLATTGNVTFNGVVTVLAGDDNDTVILGSATTHAAFNGLAASTFDGGNGTDTLTYLANGNTFVVAPTILNFETIA